MQHLRPHDSPGDAAVAYRKNSLVLRLKFAKVVKFGCQLNDQLKQSTVGRSGQSAGWCAELPTQ